jgi:molybdenum cofactor biosynthesis enzyme MoaA
VLVRGLGALHRILADEWRVMNQRRFHFLILFVTGRCNARCSFCFYAQEMERSAEQMSLAEIERLAQTVPPFEMLLLSGGEPFLRQDLAALVGLFCQHNDVRVVSIPTNGLLPGRIESTTGRILEGNPGLKVSVNLSLDGFAEIHDSLRGVPGSFDQVEQALARLTRLRQSYSGRLSVNLNSVICARNYEILPDLARHAAAHYDLDGHFFELVREQSRDKSMLQVPPDALRRLYAELFGIQLAYLEREPFPLRWRRKVLLGRNLCTNTAPSITITFAVVVGTCPAWPDKPSPSWTMMVACGLASCARQSPICAITRAISRPSTTPRRCRPSGARPNRTRAIVRTSALSCPVACTARACACGQLPGSMCVICSHAG